jgi:two-component system CheB/CheR fusion protein
MARKNGSPPGVRTPPGGRVKPDSPPSSAKGSAGADARDSASNPAVPPEGKEPTLPFPIVAIGASAGGIEAITRLLEALPRDTGMAFVIVQHLSPAHESMLTEILGRTTAMPVSEAENDTPVAANHVYVIPPNRTLGFAGGMLKLTPRTESRGQARPIDDFMRSLADAHSYRSIGVVLSGSATDGTMGLEEIKAAGGITFAQDSTAEQGSMPRSAIAAGVVDFVLPPDEIAHELARIAHHPYVAPIVAATQLFEEEPAFQRVIDMLRQSTGVDFAKYKRNTLQRRITRRMVLHKLDGLRDYLRMLQARPEELEALYQDVLINVTSFFRNPEAYDTLKSRVFPKLTEERGRNDSIRVWSLGCSTGEEAYSIAIAYTEFCEASGRRVPLQVFATDVNAASIDKARAGVYPRTIAQEMSPDRLRRFFAESDGNYRISKSIRDLCVFARHNALSDPPFSRIDLVACRNFLIYLEPALQQRIIPLLHYALRPDGYLWLGGSETIGTYRDLFELADAKGKIYLRKPSKRVPELAVPLAVGRWGAAAAAAHPRAPAPREPTMPDPLRDADRVLLARYAPPGVVVNDDLDVLQFRGDTGPFLSPAPGRATLNLLKMLREGLLVAVRGALHRARRERATVREEGLRVRSNGGWREVDVVVMPVQSGDVRDGTWLVLFEEPADRLQARARELMAEARASAERSPPARDESSQQEIARLKQELSATREYLQSVIEQQEAANEELQSANEEVQSANEELQSINEELETSKEEIQSANEELATVNDELQNRNHELSQTNNDLTNLLASVNVAIVMLGPDLRIRRFTQPAEKILNLIHADIGRPLSDIKLNFDVPDLEPLVLDVIENVTVREREVQDRNGRWYSLRVRPYRTFENKIEGAVVMLVDVDKLKRAESSLRESEGRFELLADSAPVLIWVNDLDGCRFVNRAFESFVGDNEEAIRKAGLAAYVHPEDRIPFVETGAAAAHEKRDFEMRLRFRRADGAYKWMKVLSMPRFLDDGSLAGSVGCMLDITDMAEAEAALRELDRGRNEFLAVLAHELRNPLSGVRNAASLLVEPKPAALAQARAIIERQTQHMVRLIDDLLDVSRITYGKIHLDMQPVDLVAAARPAIEATQADRDHAGQALETQLPQGPLLVRGDGVRLDQVLTNLLGNASKFTGGGGHIRLAIAREMGPGETPLAVVRVGDDGAGIEPAMLTRIFDLFVQGERGERPRAGMGIGLSLARRLVELHDGTLEAKSDGPGKGSEFVVRLPLLAPDAPRDAAAPA